MSSPMKTDTRSPHISMTLPGPKALLNAMNDCQLTVS